MQDEIVQPDEPIKQAITSRNTSGNVDVQTYIVYHDGGLKIFQQHTNGTTVTVNIEPEDMEEIIEAIQSSKPAQ